MSGLGENVADIYGCSQPLWKRAQRAISPPPSEAEMVLDGTSFYQGSNCQSETALELERLDRHHVMTEAFRFPRVIPNDYCIVSRRLSELRSCIVNLLHAFQLIPALQVIFTNEIEFEEDSFRELSAEQYEIFGRKHGPESERIFEILPIEQTVIERTEEKVTFELQIVMESEKKLLLSAVKFFHHMTKADGMPANTSLHDRLEYLRKRLPPSCSRCQKAEAAPIPSIRFPSGERASAPATSAPINIFR